MNKSLVSNFWILIVVCSVLLPFIIAGQDVLTRLILKFEWYRIIQDTIVPYELSVIATLLESVGVVARGGPGYVQYMKDGQPQVIFLAWNCVGWQSFMFLAITLISGLSGNYTRRSKIEAILIGLLGTYLVNIFRLTTVVWVYANYSRDFAKLYHDWLSNIFTIVWIIVFWWIIFRYVLEEKRQNNENTNA